MMQKSRLGLFLIALLIIQTTDAFDISIEKSGARGTYYRFWFVYACISAVMTVILAISISISMCRRYKLVAGQEQEVGGV
ncbi:hypothetical protein GCK72_000402 [Caenorhabditis remanei]|uniref:Uncharacterized protein n=1 Tax=Caenorhabditis remanei TaxID=31234 RepID=A0A6A5HK85_CAERE|nr:hypothetical protein GCK72_000402 [Caenorhabditis remanei]KAF1768590.1 hypothetical protein GCK72_000402 [Caenorhabditis remanei]